MEKWIVFRYGVKELLAYTVNGTFEGELKNTMELLAQEHGIHANEISIVIEER